LLALAVTLGVLVAGLVGILAVTRGGEPAEIAQGDVYSTDAGDPLDVFYGPGDRGLMCMNVGAFSYGSGISCVDPAAVDDTGSWTLEIPDVRQKPPLVVGILPADAGGATVQVGSTQVEASTRGRWFLARLPVGSLGPGNNAPVEVAFRG
jgi:hypothetical protein